MITQNIYYCSYRPYIDYERLFGIQLNSAFFIFRLCKYNFDISEPPIAGLIVNEIRSPIDRQFGFIPIDTIDDVDELSGNSNYSYDYDVNLLGKLDELNEGLNGRIEPYREGLNFINLFDFNKNYFFNPFYNSMINDVKLQFVDRLGDLKFEDLDLATTVLDSFNIIYF